MEELGRFRDRVEQYKNIQYADFRAENLSNKKSDKSPNPSSVFLYIFIVLVLGGLGLTILLHDLLMG